MRTWRENPESEANQIATKNHEREIFALKMQELKDKEFEECDGFGLDDFDDECLYCNGIGKKL